MFEKLFGRFFKKKGGKAEKKNAPAPSKEAVNESVGAETSALNEEAPENALSAPSPVSDAQPLDDKPPSGLINMNAGLEKKRKKLKKQTETETESHGLTLSMRWVTAYQRW